MKLTKLGLAALALASVTASSAGASPRPQAAAPPHGHVGHARVEMPETGIVTLPVKCSRTQVMTLTLARGKTVRGACRHRFAVRFALGRHVATRLAGRPVTATVRVGRAQRTIELSAAAARARSADVWDDANLWTDAWLECYPNGGGLLGGGTNNKSVRLNIQFRFNTWTTIAWELHLEMYINGTHIWQWDDPNATNHWYGSFSAGPLGIWEFSEPYVSFYDGGTSRDYYPWTKEFTFYKSDRVVVRTWVGLATYNASTRAWSTTTWHPARPVSPALGYQPGYCAI